jgi:hypothetical protein
VRLAAWPLLGLLAGCERRAPPPPSEPAPGVEVPSTPRVDPSRRCALRAAPPSRLAEVAAVGGVALAWNGTHFAVAWGDVIDGERAVRFVRVRPDGERLGSPLRVSELHTEAESPSVTWNGQSWVVVWSGGLRDVGDIYQARVDPRGTAAGRPWRMTRGDERTDLHPRILSAAPGFGVAWVARAGGNRWGLYAQALDRFDAPRAFPAKLLDTGISLSETSLVWTGTEWGVAALGARREVLGVEFARMDARGFAHGSVARLSSGTIGGVETRGRYALTWDGARYVVAWSEVLDGASHVFVRSADARGRLDAQRLDLRDEAESAEAPALERVGDGVSAVAWQVSRDGRGRLRVKTLDASGRLQEDPVELQDHDGAAGWPHLAAGGDSLAVVSATPQGLTYHRVTLGPCEVRVH